MKRLILLLILVFGFANMSAFASNTPDLCPDLTGIWQGTYYDPSGLFISRNFPLKIAMVYSHGHLYGYTLPTADSMGAKYGIDAPEFFAANCTDNEMEHIILLPEPHACGQPTRATVTLTSSRHITIPLHWENAMTGTTFIAKLTRISDPSFQINQRWVYDAERMDKSTCDTCH